jgi:hypothetical protein
LPSRGRVDPNPEPPAPVVAHPAAATAARPTAESKSAASSELFMTRLKAVAEKQQEYHVHLIHDGNRECFKNLVLKNIPVDIFFFLWITGPI